MTQAKDGLLLKHMQKETRNIICSPFMATSALTHTHTYTQFAHPSWPQVHSHTLTRTHTLLTLHGHKCTLSHTHSHTHSLRHPSWPKVHIPLPHQTTNNTHPLHQPPTLSLSLHQTHAPTSLLSFNRSLTSLHRRCLRHPYCCCCHISAL